MLATLRPERWWSLTGLLIVMALAPQVVGAEPNAKFACLIEPKMVLKLGTPVPGLISEMLVDRGDFVKKGDVVARLESGVEAATVALAKARAENDATVQSGRAKLNFQTRKAGRALELRRNDNIAVASADEAATGAKVAEAELHEAEINLQLAQLELARSVEVLNQRTIRSPIDGVIVERKLGPGEYAYDQSHLLSIAQIDPLNVEVYVPLSQFGRLHSGMQAEVYLEDPIGGKYDASVTVVDRVFDAASGTIGVRLDLPNATLAIPAGLKCQVSFIGVS